MFGEIHRGHAQCNGAPWELPAVARAIRSHSPALPTLAFLRRSARRTLQLRGATNGELFRRLKHDDAEPDGHSGACAAARRCLDRRFPRRRRAARSPRLESGSNHPPTSAMRARQSAPQQSCSISACLRAAGGRACLWARRSSGCRSSTSPARLSRRRGPRRAPCSPRRRSCWAASLFPPLTWPRDRSSGCSSGVCDLHSPSFSSSTSRATAVCTISASGR